MQLQTLPLNDTPTEAQLAPVTALTDGKLTETWRRSRHPYSPQLHLGDGVAFLTMRRAHTAVTKVVASAWHESADIDGAVAALLDYSRERGDARLLWEIPAEPPAHPENIREVLTRAGGWQLREPYASADGTENVAGWALAAGGGRHPEPPYYAQTTDFTCGAVSALLTVNHLTGGGLAGADRQGDRRAELAFWRRATNMPAIDPTALLVELAAELPEHEVSLSISQDGPVLLEGSDGFMRESKVLLQHEARMHAEQARLRIVTEWQSVSTLAAALQAGAVAIVLIDEVPMHNDPTPHWVIAHAADERYIYIQDPWINAPEGETWLDGHDLPIAIAEFDAMARWGDPAYRAIIEVR
ncbi:peptidase C39 family protein [uncultured Gulosibacter sp.]|uniref:peptidase C39 family protein n=1 Tax=uncultured Gulosibacter sp. TaxID=1339167 RepID=UPI00288B2A70|nr:peptidase C39 family protein [uncultured Gulosibacter sp.]